MCAPGGNVKPIAVDTPQPSHHLDHGPYGFTLNGSTNVRIRFTDEGAFIGCHKVYSAAMNELCERWMRFRQRLKEEVVQ